MKTFFTADTHFGHSLTTRGYDNVEDADESLMHCINVTVGGTDRLFILGDFAWRSAQSYLEKIRCRNVHLTWGNHDKRSFSRLFKTVAEVTELKFGEQKVWLSHYAHAYWPASHRGSVHLYGHNHDGYEAVLDAAFPGRRSMDCSVDTAYRLLGEHRPFEVTEIFDLLSGRPGHHPMPAWREHATS